MGLGPGWHSAGQRDPSVATRADELLENALAFPTSLSSPHFLGGISEVGKCSSFRLIMSATATLGSRASPTRVMPEKTDWSSVAASSRPAMEENWLPSILYEGSPEADPRHGI